ncbi:cytochrome b5-like heme/steroid binding domain-containing protein [Russula earlei]|uniref:Cytochrome b5-like heme/steroid binding domain-containing protein n=1 Tax=Russula earlei TaxID=71964 RepID=A0ACC0UNY0_9AGAM|nr:cytochrome b5-like heme/steroid binding domain-containing protein [Russula earlei]
MATKIITLEELREHTTKDSLWVLLHGKVYDVTKFIDEHPGGDEVILSESGKDATEAFEDVGHSDEARGHLPGMHVGDFEKGASVKAKAYQSTASAAAVENAVEQTSNAFYFVPLAVLVAYFAWRFYS